MALAAPAAPKPVTVSVGDVELTAGDWDYSPAEVLIGGERLRGYGFARGSAEFDVSRFGRFEAQVGVIDGQGRAAKMSAELDGKVVWSEEVMPNDPPLAVSIPIEGQQRLTLRSDSASAVFAEPRLHPAATKAPAATGPQPAAPQAVEASEPGFRRAAEIRPTDGPLAGQVVYHNSFALLIGIDQHQSLPPAVARTTALADVVAVGLALQAGFGVPVDNIAVLAGEDTTLANLRSALAWLQNPDVVQAEDRVIVYVSAAARTVEVGGRSTGFILPYDADVDPTVTENAAPYRQSCLSLDELAAALEACPAKHVLTLLEACVGGVTADPAPTPPDTSAAGLAALASGRARQVVVAGGPGQSYPDNPALGHPVFTFQLLVGLGTSTMAPGAVLTAGQLYDAVRLKLELQTGGRQVPVYAKSDAPGQVLFLSVPPFEPLPETLVGTELDVDPLRGPAGHFYLPVKVEGGLRWSEAAEQAAALSYRGRRGHLLTITSADEQRWVQQNLHEACIQCYWLGGYQDRRAPDFREPDRGWRWVTGEPWDFTAWNQTPYREPNNVDGDADFLSFIAQGTWNDEIATRSRPGFVVEFGPR